jgi:hypothetical protein
MIRLKPKNLELSGPGKWSEFYPGTRFCVRPLTGTIRKKLVDLYAPKKSELNPLTRKMETISDLQAPEYDRGFKDYLLADWEGVADPDGNPVEEKTLENKLWIFDQPEFDEHIVLTARSLDIEAEQVKNS